MFELHLYSLHKFSEYNTTLTRAQLLQNVTSRNQKHPSIIWCKVYFDVLNHLHMTHSVTNKTDQQSDGQTF